MADEVCFTIKFDQTANYCSVVPYKFVSCYLFLIYNKFTEINVPLNIENADHATVSMA